MKNIFAYIITFILGFFIAFFYGDKIFEEKKEKIELLDYSFLDEVILEIDKKFVDTREDKSKKNTHNDRIFGAAQGLVNSYGDSHTVFFPPEDGKIFSDDIDGEFSGVGMEITNIHRFLTVVAPLPNSPAEKSGIKAKDVISKIDGKNSLEMSSHSAVKLIRGKKGQEVVLEVLRKGEKEPLEIRIKRDTIKIPVVKTFVKDDVFVIKLFTFSENSPKLFFSKIVKEFKESKKDKMIIDLRGNSGGLLTAGVFISGLFLEKGSKIITEDYNGKKENKTWVSGDVHQNPDKTTNIFKNLKLGILVDGGSASASEILTGALLDNEKAIIFGENTFGKGTVQELINFDNGSSLKVTIAKFILPGGDWISYKGIAPDVEILRDEDDEKEDREKGSYSDYIDSQMLEVISYLSKIKNQNDFELKIKDFAKLRIKNKSQKSKEEKAKQILNGDE